MPLYVLIVVADCSSLGDMFWLFEKATADMPALQVRRQTSESFRPTPLWIPFASRTESTHEQTKSLAASVVRQLAFFPSPKPWLRTGNQNVLTFSRRGFIFWEGVHQPVMTHLNHVTVWAAGNWINLFWFTRIPGILTVLFLHCPCRSFNGRLGGRWQRQVLDTGLRGDPPALRVLDALLEANEFILWRGRGRKLGFRGSSECFQGISQSYKVIGQDWTPCSMFLWALYSVRMLYHRVSTFGWGRRFGLLNSWIL